MIIAKNIDALPREKGNGKKRKGKESDRTKETKTKIWFMTRYTVSLNFLTISIIKHKLSNYSSIKGQYT